MDDSTLERFSRHFPLQSIGKAGQLKLKNRRVLIAGIGGLGTASAELLASIGVGYLRIVDYDVVELSNLPRQKLFNDSDIGKAKVEVAEERLKLRNPEIEIDAHTTRIDALSAQTLLDGIDVVIDALDLFSSRKALFRVARQKAIPFVFCGAIAEQANIMTFTHLPDHPCLECVVGEVGDDPNQRCEIRGVHPSVLSIAASVQVAEALRLLLGKNSNLEKSMLYIDLEYLEFDKIQFAKKENCKLCNASNDKDELDGGREGDVRKGIRSIGEFGNALVTSLCGRDTKIIDPEWEIHWNFEEVEKKLRQHYHIAVSGKKYLTFSFEGIGISLLDSGVATIRGSKQTSNAIRAYSTIYDLITEQKYYT